MDVTITVAELPPQIIQTTPLAGATHVSLLTPIEVRFSEPIVLAQLTAPGALTVTTTTGVSVAGTRSARLDRQGLAFLPDRPLAYGKLYSVRCLPCAERSRNHSR